MLEKIVRFVGGDPHQKILEGLAAEVAEINALESQYESLDDQSLREKTTQFRRRLAKGESLDDLLTEAFAAVREASKRMIGQRHYDVQMIGGIAMHRCFVAEMRTGEGKTLVVPEEEPRDVGHAAHREQVAHAPQARRDTGTLHPRPIRSRANRASMMAPKTATPLG